MVRNDAHRAQKGRTASLSLLLAGNLHFWQRCGFSAKAFRVASVSRVLLACVILSACALLFGGGKVQGSKGQPSLTWLGTLGGKESEAFGVSADGKIVVGRAENAWGNRHAFLWKDGKMQDLGTLGGDWSEAHDVSADGKVVVGSAKNASGEEPAFLWKDGKMKDLGTLGGGWSKAFAVSADGKIVVGWAENASGEWRAFRWTQAKGMEDLNKTYAGLLKDGSVLRYATAISPDGRYIVGQGYNAKTNRHEAFLLKCW